MGLCLGLDVSQVADSSKRAQLKKIDIWLEIDKAFWTVPICTYRLRALERWQTLPLYLLDW